MSKATLAAATQKIRAAAAAENAKLVEQFEALGGGPEAVETLAAQYGVDRKSMRQRLIRHGCEVPNAWRLAGERRRRISDDDRAEMVRLYAAGWSQSQVADRFGVEQTYVSYLLRADGVPTRPFDIRSGRDGAVSAGSSWPS